MARAAPGFRAVSAHHGHEGGLGRADAARAAVGRGDRRDDAGPLVHPHPVRRRADGRSRAACSCWGSPSSPGVGTRGHAGRRWRCRFSPSGSTAFSRSAVPAPTPCSASRSCWQRPSHATTTWAPSRSWSSPAWLAGGRPLRPLAAIPRGPLLAVGLALPVLAYARSSFTVEQHPAARAYVTQTMREIVETVAAAPTGSTVYIENGRTNPVIGRWLESVSARSGWPVPADLAGPAAAGPPGAFHRARPEHPRLLGRSSPVPPRHAARSAPARACRRRRVISGLPELRPARPAYARAGRGRAPGRGTIRGRRDSAR